MSTTLNTFQFFDHVDGANRSLVLVDGAESAHLEFVATQWSPILSHCHDRAVLAFESLPPAQQTEDTWQGKQQLFAAPDSHWDWSKKHHAMRQASHRIVAILNDVSVESLMRIDLSKASRLESQGYVPVLYVDYLAVAPWNRAPIQNPVRFKGLGKLMLAVAVAVSRAEGMEGRCALHSLRQSEGFYRRLGMTDLGPDAAAQGLRYFEFSVASANTLLEEP